MRPNRAVCSAQSDHDLEFLCHRESSTRRSYPLLVAKWCLLRAQLSWSFSACSLSPLPPPHSKASSDNCSSSSVETTLLLRFPTRPGGSALIPSLGAAVASEGAELRVVPCLLVVLLDLVGGSSSVRLAGPTSPLPLCAAASAARSGA